MTPTPMPEQVTIGPYQYRVVLDQAAIDAACRAEKTDLCGHTHHLRQTITLSPELGPDGRAETLLHECLHAILLQTNPIADLEAAAEERLVSTLAYSLLDLLRRNPELVQYLMDSDNLGKEN